MKKPLKYTCFDIVLKHVHVYTCIRKVGSTFKPHIAQYSARSFRDVDRFSDLLASKIESNEIEPEPVYQRSQFHV